jgi:hypothetical protein
LEKSVSAGAPLEVKMGLDQVLKNQNLTTSFEDVDQTGSKLPDY